MSHTAMCDVAIYQSWSRKGKGEIKIRQLWALDFRQRIFSKSKRLIIPSLKLAQKKLLWCQTTKVATEVTACITDKSQNSTVLGCFIHQTLIVQLTRKP
jgi:hypothetical protein